MQSRQSLCCAPPDMHKLQGCHQSPCTHSSVLLGTPSKAPRTPCFSRVAWKPNRNCGVEKSKQAFVQAEAAKCKAVEGLVLRSG